MVAKPAPKSAASKKVVAKASATKLAVQAKSKIATVTGGTSDKSKRSTVVNGWLQDATLEIPVSPATKFAPGERELEFSIGMRQQEDGDQIRSELRGRALVHAGGAVLALAEASYVTVCAEADLPENLPQQLYAPLRTHLESLLALGGHTPPLPATLDKVE